MNAPVQAVIGWVKAWRFYVLLVVLIGFITLAPFFPPPSIEVEVIPDLLISLVLLAALGCLQFRKRGIASLRWFGLFTLIGGWLPIILPSPVVSAAVALLRIGFFLVVTAALIYQVAVSKKVHFQLIVGAIDGYLLLGIAGAIAFAVLDLVLPGSVQHPGGVPARSDYMYFSFITMLTVGYGDIVPVSIPARTVAMFLGVGGQMYVAILVAILVGKYIAASQAEHSGT